MTCEEISAALNDYVDGRRDTAICEELEKHHG
ncbi:MAG: zf-HC2 domain-containing protein [Planctomycetes bacterium]|nr:zf-HC2 domain-containing protein [Planctomycetota bacterium]MBU4398250.1 zf-HC2 domain-containing protein [Planctomycetota bacterium]MCG2683455.1 zf-HC2 domain-containing protein [Planctomycetales bacterium]